MKTNSKKKNSKSKLILVLAFIAIIIPLMASTCGGSPPATPDFSVSANSLTITQGESGTTQVTVTSTGGFSDMVALSLQGAPADLGSNFDPSSTDTTSTLTLTVPVSVSPGNYPLTIKGQANGNIKTSSAFTLTVKAKADNSGFDLDVDPKIVEITKRSASASALEPQLILPNATVEVQITRKNGFDAAVQFDKADIVGLPSGVKAEFTPAVVPGNTSSLKLTLTGSPSADTYNVTIKGISGTKEAEASFSLKINDPVAVPDFSLSVNKSNLTIKRGTSGTITVTINGTGGFSDSVKLSVSGLPSGVNPSGTAGFSSNPATDTSTLTLSATATAELVTNKTITITGTVGAKTKTKTFELSIMDADPVPDFKLTIATEPSNIKIKREEAKSIVINIERMAGFSGDVALSHSELPFHVYENTGSGGFDPNPVSGSSSTFKLVAGADADLGTKTITITGKSGGKTRTVSFDLTVQEAVNQPDFTISADDIIIEQGKTGTVAITIHKTGGFTGNVSLTHSGVPDKVTPLFTTTGATTFLKLDVGLGAARKTKTITITGTGAGKTHSTTFELKVKSPASAAIVAYAWANKKSIAVYTPDTYYSYNSSGGAITAKHIATGYYKITFAGINTTGGNVQVTAYDSNNYCNVSSWGGPTVFVHCYDSLGIAADSLYSVVVSKKGASSSAKTIAYAWANKSTSASYTPNATRSYNSSGGAITAKHIATGRYEITFAGINTDRGNVQVTAYGGSENYCNVAGWGRGPTVFVHCYDSLGTAADSLYNVVVSKKGASSSAKTIAYAWANKITSASYTPYETYSYNSNGGAITAKHITTGRYEITFSGISLNRGNIQVTAQSNNKYCNAALVLGSTVFVYCYSSSGVAANSQYNINVDKK